MPTFLPGLRLSGLLYRDAVRPLLDRHFPGVCHSATLLGPGSEVLGFDTARSTDHDWGPRLQLFLSPPDLAAHRDAISDMLAERLPGTVAGYSTNLEPIGERGTRHLRPARGRIRHGVTIVEPGAWLTGCLGFDPRAPIGTLDWLATPTQTLAELTAGEVFHDGLDQLRPVRRRLRWYPEDVWRYVLACQWQRLSEEEAFVGRCAEVGDETGSAVVAARLVREVMRLCLLLDRRYPPYGKWLGSAFAALPCATRLRPMLTDALAAGGRLDRLADAYSIVATLQNAVALTGPVDPGTRPFHDRPYRVLHAERFAQALRESIREPAIRELPMAGAIDQLVDNVAVSGRVEARRGVVAAVLGHRFT